MNDQNQKITITSKQLFTFLGIAITITIGVLLFFFISSGKKTDSTPTIQDTQDITPRLSNPASNNKSGSDFLGEKGETIEATDDKIYIDEEQVSDGNMHSFNFYSEKEGKTIYFFIIKASDGTYRAAANACEVCFGAKKGFRQVGNLIRCENCRVTYPKDKIALEKGGCNPGPIDKNVSVKDGKLVIKVSDLEKVAYLI